MIFLEDPSKKSREEKIHCESFCGQKQVLLAVPRDYRACENDMKMLRASNKQSTSSARPIDNQASTRATEKGVLDEP